MESINPTPLSAGQHPFGSEQQADLAIADLAALFKACGDPLRLQILRVLQQGAFGVLELAQLFDTRQSGMSHHLKILANSGLVEAQREGNSIFYRRPFSQTNQGHQEQFNQEAISNFFELIDQLPLPAEVLDSINTIQQQRAVQSQAFFAKNAARFKEQQELIADFDQYAEASFKLLTQNEFGAHASALEVGPGEGAFLSRLSAHFDQVIALDNSEEMLQAARQFANRQHLTNVSFLLGDCQRACIDKIRVDAIVMNMVLHHVPAPADVFSECFELLKPGGVLVVCDLLHHDQPWTRESCGDLWLGFETAELGNWAVKSGFEDVDSLYIGLRNGFQVQLRKFIKPLSKDDINKVSQAVI